MFAFLPRLLLCLCLLADTVGPAMAATHLAQTQGAAAEAASHPGAGMDRDCHDMQGGEATSPPAPAAQPATGGDCLERCLELCMQQGSAALTASRKLPQPYHGPAPAAETEARQAQAHALPSLRPPIG